MFLPMRRAIAASRFVAVAILLLSLPLPGCGDSSTELTTYGTLVIDVQPDAAAAAWHLAGPGGATRDGTGDAALADVPTGSWTVTWGTAVGYDTPPVATLSLGEGQSLTFTGAYAVTGMIFPDTPDKLMQNFQAMYASMNPAALAPLLHSQYVMILQANTYNQFPSLGTTLDPVEEQRIHTRMFSGQDVTDPEGYLIPAVEQITFQTFRRQNAWALSPPADQIPDTPMALYEVVILFGRGPGHTILKVQGTLKAYAAAVDTVVGGATQTCYRMRGLVDLTGDLKGATSEESHSLGLVKGLFRLDID